MIADHTEEETFGWALKKNGLDSDRLSPGRALQEGLCPHVGEQKSACVFQESK